MDYPILVDIHDKSGVDAILEYVQAIRIEQKFLNRFNRDYVIETLGKVNPDYRCMIENVCDIILMNVVRHSMPEDMLKGNKTVDVIEDTVRHIIRQMVDRAYHY